MRRYVLLVVAIVMINAVLLLRLIWKERPAAVLAEVKAAIAELPNVRISEVPELPDEYFDSVSVSFVVSGKGELGFGGLTGRSFKRTSHLQLSRLGTYRFRFRKLEHRAEYYGAYLDIGPDSPVPAIRTLKIQNVGQAIGHYDKLLRIVSGWPIIDGEWPSHWPPKEGKWSESTSEEAHFPDPPRADYFFCLKR